MAREYTRSTDYQLKKLELVNFQGDIIPLNDSFNRIMFFESIYESFTSGVIEITDSYDISQFFPLLGEEELRFKFTTDGTVDIEKIFHVYRTETNQKENVLTHILHFVSKELMIDQNTSISKSYLKKDALAIVKDIYSFFETDKKLIAETTTGLHHVVIPSWSPIQAINWVSSFAQHPSFVGGTFLFFENKEGYNFTCVEKLIDTTPEKTYSAPIQNLTNDNNTGNSIRSFTQLSGTLDTLKSMSEGMYANSVIAYDNISKSYKTYKYDYQKNFDDTKHLNEFRLVSPEFKFTSEKQRISIVPSTLNRENSSYFKEKFGDPLSHRIEETAYYKTTLLSQLSARQFEIDFNGDSNLTCGQVVNIELPNISQLETKKAFPHRFNRKKFLLVSCMHSFTKTSYIVTARAVSDTLVNEPKYDL